MSLNDVNDDLGTAQEPYKCVAVVPVHGRLPLLKHTIQRLYKKNGCYRVICVGDGQEEKKLCESLGAVWVSYSNKPLGAKWNAGFLAAKQYNPHSCLYVGSSDWLSDNWIDKTKEFVEKYDLIGVPGCYFLDVNNVFRLVYWPGYEGTRADESIGIGRILSRNLLEKLNWMPFDNKIDGSLDRSMKDRAAKFGISDFMVPDNSIHAVSISTNLWENKHKFEHHWSGMLKSEKIVQISNFLTEYFPEAYEFHASIRKS